MKILDLKTVRRLGLHMGKTTFRCAAFAAMMLGYASAAGTLTPTSPPTTFDGYMQQVYGTPAATWAAVEPKVGAAIAQALVDNHVALLDANGNLTQPLLYNARVGGSDVGTDISKAVYSTNSGQYARVLQDRFSDVVNVRDFGAKCDVGTSMIPTDDTKAVQSALTYASTQEYGFVVLPGMCRTTQTLTASVSGHLGISGGGLVVDGGPSSDGIDLTMVGKGKFFLDHLRFRAGSSGANRPLSILGNGGDIEDNSDFITNLSVTTSDESIRGAGFANGVYLYGLVAFLSNTSVTFPQIASVNGKDTMVSYTTPGKACSLTLAGTPRGSSSTLNGGGSMVSNFQGNGGFADLCFVGMSQGGVFTNLGSNWQTHIVYAGTDVVSPQTFTFIAPSSQTGWWSVNDGILFDFEVAGGQYLITNGLFNGPMGAGAWSVLKCHGCTAVQFTNNQVDMNYPSSIPVLDSGSAGDNGTAWNVSGNTFGAPNTAAMLSNTTATINFAGLKSSSELTFLNNSIGLLPGIVPPPLVAGASGNLGTVTGNVIRSLNRKASQSTLPTQLMEQGRLAPDWETTAILHGSGSPVATGYIPLTLDGSSSETTANSIATLRPFNTVGRVVFYSGTMYCYEWGESTPAHYGSFLVSGTFSIKPGAPDVYTLMGSKDTILDSSWSSNGEKFEPRFVVSDATSLPSLQVVNVGTAQSTVTCTAHIRQVNLQ